MKGYFLDEYELIPFQTYCNTTIYSAWFDTPHQTIPALSLLQYINFQFKQDSKWKDGREWEGGGRVFNYL